MSSKGEACLLEKAHTKSLTKMVLDLNIYMQIFHQMDNKSLPQYYRNTLQPIVITEKSLDESLSELTNCLTEGLRKLETNTIEARTYNDYGSIFNGQLGNGAYPNFLSIIFLLIAFHRMYLSLHTDTSPSSGSEVEFQWKYCTQHRTFVFKPTQNPLVPIGPQIG